MKRHRKAISITLALFILVVGGGYLFIRSTLQQFHEKGVEIADIEEKQNPIEDVKEDEDINEEEKEEEIDPYVKMIRDSKRVNILCLGVAQPLTDTIIVASFDPEINKLDMISVPRDTYLHREGYDYPGQKKINASFVGEDTLAKAQSSMNAVRDVLQIPIHHFIKVEYKGVEKIVDSIGGVEVNIPFNMYYDDPIDKLHIRFSKGKQTLKGADAVKYLRFRQNNDNTHSDGDLGRIERQQEFIKLAINKALGIELIGVINIAKDYMKTSLTAEEMIYYANKLSRIDKDDINSYILTGEAKRMEGLEFYLSNEDKTKEMIEEIYTKE